MCVALKSCQGRQTSHDSHDSGMWSPIVQVNTLEQAILICLYRKVLDEKSIVTLGISHGNQKLIEN